MIDNISVGVFIHDKVKSECDIVKNSWVTDFKNYLFLGNSFDKNLPTITPDVDVGDDYESSTSKFFYCFAKQLEKHPECEWFFSCGYDVFVHSTNLHTMLKKHDPTKDLYIGGHGDVRTIAGLTVEFASGGPGIILTKSLVAKIVPKIESYLKEWRNPNLSGNIGYFTPDVAIAYFLKRDFNVSLTREEGFYFFNYDSYLNEDQHHHNKFKLIEDPISFHNVKPIHNKVLEHKAKAKQGEFPYTTKNARTKYYINRDDIITGNKFRELGTIVLDGSPVEIKLIPENNRFFIHTDFVPLFQEKVLPKITYPFKIITHNGDNPVREEFRSILDNPYLIRWYGMNTLISHPKLVTIPIGIANEKFAHGNKDELIDVVRQRNKKDKLVYCNFDPSTNVAGRLQALNQLKTSKFITFDFTKRPYKEYLEIVSQHKYIISPAGNGVDCHRIWESIYLGTIPIVPNHSALDYFKDLPILWVNDFTEVTKRLLLENIDLSYRAIHKSLFNYYKSIIL